MHSVPGVAAHAVLIPKGAVTADFVEMVGLPDRLIVAIGDAPASGLKSAFVARFIAAVFRRLVESRSQVHVGNILTKLQVTSRRELSAMWASGVA